MNLGFMRWWRIAKLYLHRIKHTFETLSIACIDEWCDGEND
jgi:hypothetical protein